MFWKKNVGGDVGEWLNPNNDVNGIIEADDTIYIQELKPHVEYRLKWVM